MQTKNMDIVYFVKDGYTNEELRYSLRSVCKNMQYRRAWIFGGAPNGITPDVHVWVEQSGATKWDRVRNMFVMACSNKELTDDFILFNDDFFVMRPMDKIEPWYRSSLEDHMAVLGNGPYKNLLKRVNSELKEMGETTLSYELHVPFIFNKDKLKRLIADSPELHCTRTLYGNIFDVGGVKHRDIKVFNSRPDFDYKASELLSTDDSIVNINNDVWRFIKKQFSGKCKYERY